MVRFRKPYIVFLLSALLLGTPRTGSAQEATSTSLFGPFVAYEYGLPLALERSPGQVEWCVFCDGTGTSYEHRGRFGAFLQFQNPDRISTDIRLSLSVSSGKFTSNAYNSPLIDPGTGTTIQTSRLFIVTSFVAGLSAQVQGKKNIMEGWQIGLGPWLEYWMISRFVHRESLLDPAEVTFPENSERSRVVNEGDLLGSGPLSFGVLLSTAIELPLSRKFKVIPELYTRIDGWGLINGLGFRSMSLGTGFSLGPQTPQTLLPPFPSHPAPPTPPPPPPPTRPLTASIDLYGIDSEGHPVQEIYLLPRKTLHRRHTEPTEEWILEDYLLPELSITPTIIADAGIRSWTFSIRRDGKEIARTTSEDKDQSLNLEISIEADSVPSELIAEFVVEDSTGAMTAARDRLPVIPPAAQASATGLRDIIEHQWILPMPEENITHPDLSLLDNVIATGGNNSLEILLIPGSDAPQLLAYAETIRKYLRKASSTPDIILGFSDDSQSSLSGDSGIAEDAILLLLRQPWNQGE